MYGFDVDETLTMDINAYAPYMIRKLGLSVDVNTSFDAFLAHSEVQAYRKTRNDQFLQCFKQAGSDATVLMGLSPRRGAVDGVRYLSQLGRAAYYTARAPQFQELSQTWLRTHGFPDLDYFACYNFLQKYAKLYLHTRESSEPAILIDDRAKGIAEAWPQVVQKWPPIGKLFPQRFVLVAFGYTQETLFSVDVPFPVLPLPSWELEQVHKLVASLSFKEETYHV